MRSAARGVRNLYGNKHHLICTPRFASLPEREQNKIMAGRADQKAPVLPIIEVTTSELQNETIQSFSRITDAAATFRSRVPHLFLRQQRVILDADVAELYRVPVRTLNQVKRNRERFPPDFLFQLTREEEKILRSQTVISRRKHGGRRYAPYAFTEHGAIMAATVLNSKQAVRTSVFVVRAFVRLRELLATDRRLASKRHELERRLGTHDAAIRKLISAINSLMIAKKTRKARIGFQLPAANRTA